MLFRSGDPPPGSESWDNQAFADDGWRVTVDPADLCTCCDDLRSGSGEMETVASELPSALSPGTFPEDLRAELETSLASLRLLLQQLAHELGIEADGLDLRASHAGAAAHGSAAPLTSVANRLFGPGTFTPAQGAYTPTDAALPGALGGTPDTSELPARVELGGVGHEGTVVVGGGPDWLTGGVPEAGHGAPVNSTVIIGGATPGISEANTGGTGNSTFVFGGATPGISEADTEGAGDSTFVFGDSTMPLSTDGSGLANPDPSLSDESMGLPGASAPTPNTPTSLLEEIVLAPIGTHALGSYLDTPTPQDVNTS